MFRYEVTADGESWLCKHGRQVLHRFDDLIDAIDAAELHARSNRPSEVLFHDDRGDATVIAWFALE